MILLAKKIEFSQMPIADIGGIAIPEIYVK